MDRHPDASPCIHVAPDILHTLTKFQPRIPTQSKVTLILNNSADYPLPSLKHTQIAGALATPCTLPHIPVYETSLKTITN